MASEGNNEQENNKERTDMTVNRRTCYTGVVEHARGHAKARILRVRRNAPTLDRTKRAEPGSHLTAPAAITTNRNNPYEAARANKTFMNTD